MKLSLHLVLLLTHTSQLTYCFEIFMFLIFKCGYFQVQCTEGANPHCANPHPHCAYHFSFPPFPRASVFDL